MSQRLNRKSKQSCIVYGLYDFNNNLRYIGQTRLEIESRKKWFYKGIKQALKFGNKLTPVDRWIHTGNQFDIRIIEENATWNVSEIIYIDRFRQAGAHLLNVVRGGDDNVSGLRNFTSIAISMPKNIEIHEVVSHNFDGRYLLSEFTRYLTKHDFWHRLPESQQDDLVNDLISIVESTK